MTVSVDSWLGAAFVLALVIPSFLVSIAAGIGVFLMGEHALRRCIIRLKRSMRR